jgi:DnaJ domain
MLIFVLVCAAAGYWLVNLLLGARKPRNDPPRNAEATPAASRPAGSPGWHEVLEISPDATVEEIRAAYKRMLAQYHPDKVASLGPELRELANRKSQDITRAYRAAMSGRDDTR